MQQDDRSADFFWEIARPLLEQEGITKSTMMGFPCLRVNDKFFASVDPKSGDLVTKLPAERVLELIDQDAGAAFAPAGRRFREWVVIADRDRSNWSSLLSESLHFVGSG